MFDVGRRAFRWVSAAAALVALAVVVSGASAAAPDAKKLVLRLSDLPAGFTLQKAYYADNARAARESTTQTLAQFRRWGRITGYGADFSREAIKGIIFVTSRASTYRTAEGAADATRASFLVAGTTQRFNGRPVRFRRVSTGGEIGDEARMFSTTLTNQGVEVIVYVVLWRYGVVSANLIAGGVRGTVDAAKVVTLAVKQQARIRAATG